MLLDWTPVHDVNSIISMSDERDVQRLESIQRVREFVQIDLAGVLVAQPVDDALDLALGQVHSVPVQQADHVKGVDIALVRLVDEFEEFVDVVVVAAGDIGERTAYFQ